MQQNEYFDSNIRFADAYNSILFNGESIIKPEELEECDSVFVQLFESSKGKKLIADILLKTADISVDLETIKEIKNGKERYNMCKAIDDMKRDARNEGIHTTLYNLYCEKLLSLEKAAEKASMTVEEFLDATKKYAN